MPVQANWVLNNSESKIHFISTKNGHIGELHHFTQLKGKLSSKGYVSVTVQLSSVETGIPIRNQRMREMLFDVKDNPFAKLQAKIDFEALGLEAGISKDLAVKSMLTINGIEQPQTLLVRVANLNDGSLLVSTIEPMLINANSFQLVPGIEKLQEVAGLSSIGWSVPVSFNVVFTPIN